MYSNVPVLFVIFLFYSILFYSILFYSERVTWNVWKHATAGNITLARTWKTVNKLFIVLFEYPLAASKLQLFFLGSDIKLTSHQNKRLKANLKSWH